MSASSSNAMNIIASMPMHPSATIYNLIKSTELARKCLFNVQSSWSTESKEKLIQTPIRQLLRRINSTPAETGNTSLVATIEKKLKFSIRLSLLTASAVQSRKTAARKLTSSV